MSCIVMRLRGISQLRIFLGGTAGAVVLALVLSCGHGVAVEGSGGVKILFRGPSSWFQFQNLPALYSSFAETNVRLLREQIHDAVEGGAFAHRHFDRHDLGRETGFDFLASEACQQTIRTLASVYSTAGLPFSSDNSSEMLEEADVLVTDPIRVAEFAGNGWLAPFDGELVPTSLG